jgi:hypothetical protein
MEIAAAIDISIKVVSIDGCFVSSRFDYSLDYLAVRSTRLWVKSAVVFTQFRLRGSSPLDVSRQCSQETRPRSFSGEDRVASLIPP